MSKRFTTGSIVYTVNYRSEISRGVIEFVNLHCNILLVRYGDTVREYKLFSEINEIFLTYNEAFVYAIDKINKEQHTLNTRMVELMKRNKEFEKEINQQETK